MSGGHFDYEQYKISHIADEIEGLILNNDRVEDEWSIVPHYSAEVIEEFKKAHRLLREAYIYVQRIDWLVCGDDGEEQFHNRLRHELGRLK
jgi:hypothetical protein